MAGWESSDDIQIESVEEIIDTNPDLYKQRTIAALNQKRYREALEEAYEALKYGNKEMQYRLLVVRVLFESRDYRGCMQKLISYGLWKQVSDEPDNGDLLLDEVDFVFYAYAICYKALGMRNADTDIIIVTPDGRGMCPDIQTAINTANSKQEIVITSGTYRGNVRIENKTVHIYGTSVGEADSNIYPILTGKIEIKNSDANIYALSFNGSEAEKKIIVIDDSSVIVNQCIFFNNSGVTGVYVHKNSECTIEYCRFEYLDIGITNEVIQNSSIVRNCHFEKNRIGVTATDSIQIINTKFVKNTHSGIYAVVSRGGDISIENCEFEENKSGIGIVDSEINIRGSKFYRNYYHIGFVDAGNFSVYDTSFVGSKGPSFIGQRSYDNNRNLKEYVGYMDFEKCLLENNNSLARKDNRGMTLLKRENNLTIRNNGELNSYAEGIKSFLNKWL